MYTFSNQSGPSTALERAAVVEEFWASRNVWVHAMNAERRSAWERKWAGLSECDLSSGHTRMVEGVRMENPEARVLQLRPKKEEAQEEPGLTKLPAYRFYWQSRSLQLPTA
jgi:hypothetical protein